MINDLFRLITFSQKFAAVTRTVKIGLRESYESDAEHSHQVGFIAWYIAERLNLKTDKGKILEYSTVHDLVEVYARDTDPHLHSVEFKNSKTERERVSLERIKTEFPDFPSLYKTIQAYEAHADAESRLVYIVDKILPVINTYIARHNYYIESEVSFEKWKGWLEEKMRKVDAEKLLGQNFFAELIKFFEDHKELFAKS